MYGGGVFVFICRLMRECMRCMCVFLLVFSARALFILFRSIFPVATNAVFGILIYELEYENISNEIPANGIGIVLRHKQMKNKKKINNNHNEYSSDNDNMVAMEINRWRDEDERLRERMSESQSLENMIMTQ